MHLDYAILVTSPLPAAPPINAPGDLEYTSLCSEVGPLANTMEQPKVWAKWIHWS